VGEADGDGEGEADDTELELEQALRAPMARRVAASRMRFQRRLASRVTKRNQSAAASNSAAFGPVVEIYRARQHWM
jgi:hypothetical protein